MIEILSIGHSTLDYEAFVTRLKAEGVTAVADVRTIPHSRHQPHFSQNELKKALGADGITYVFLGKELGGRPDDPNLYTDDVADYEKMAIAPTFTNGLERLQKGAETYRIAIMCSERSPLDCHRCLLVGRALKAERCNVRHLLPEGRSIDQEGIEDQLLEMANKSEVDMFASREDRLAEAYRRQAHRVAFTEAESKSEINQFAFR